MSQPAQRQQRTRTDSRKGLARAHGSVLPILAPSKIHGVGVFATSALRRGMVLVSPYDWRIVTDRQRRRICRQQPEAAAFFARYGFATPHGTCCPKDFRRMSWVWYLNSARRPNMESLDGGFTYRARRNIRSGEELTISYANLPDAAPISQNMEVSNVPSKPNQRE